MCVFIFGPYIVDGGGGGVSSSGLCFLNDLGIYRNFWLAVFSIAWYIKLINSMMRRSVFHRHDSILDIPRVPHNSSFERKCNVDNISKYHGYIWETGQWGLGDKTVYLEYIRLQWQVTNNSAYFVIIGKKPLINRRLFLHGVTTRGLAQDSRHTL